MESLEDRPIYAQLVEIFLDQLHLQLVVRQCLFLSSTLVPSALDLLGAWHFLQDKGACSGFGFLNIP